MHLSHAQHEADSDECACSNSPTQTTSRSTCPTRWPSPTPATHWLPEQPGIGEPLAQPQTAQFLALSPWYALPSAGSDDGCNALSERFYSSTCATVLLQYQQHPVRRLSLELRSQRPSQQGANYLALSPWYTLLSCSKLCVAKLSLFSFLQVCLECQPGPDSGNQGLLSQPMLFAQHCFADAVWMFSTHLLSSIA